jgi:hypothetical protein
MEMRLTLPRSYGTIRFYPLSLFQNRGVKSLLLHLPDALKIRYRDAFYARTGENGRILPMSV